MIGIWIKWLERLSLDAVIVAVVWGIVLGSIVNLGMDLPVLLVLALSTWLTYVADRLRDVRPGAPGPATDRHLYYKNHYRKFCTLWGVVFILAILLAVGVLPLWKVLWGWLLVAGIVLYLFAMGNIQKASLRMIFKRMAVPVIFVIGVGWMAESWRTPEGLYASVILLTGAITNLLLISYWENRDKRKISWLFPAFIGSLFLMALTGLPGLLGAICFGGLAWFARNRERLPLRVMADGVLVLVAVVVWLGI